MLFLILCLLRQMWCLLHLMFLFWSLSIHILFSLYLSLSIYYLSLSATNCFSLSQTVSLAIAASYCLFLTDSVLLNFALALCISPFTLSNYLALSLSFLVSFSHSLSLSNSFYLSLSLSQTLSRSSKAWLNSWLQKRLAAQRRRNPSWPFSAAFAAAVIVTHRPSPPPPFDDLEKGFDAATFNLSAVFPNTHLTRLAFFAWFYLVKKKAILLEISNRFRCHSYECQMSNGTWK